MSDLEQCCGEVEHGPEGVRCTNAATAGSDYCADCIPEKSLEPNSCRACTHYRTRDQHIIYGECRVRAPNAAPLASRVPGGRMKHLAIWPWVKETDLCGDWQTNDTVPPHCKHHNVLLCQECK